jgi:hypothetical protein
MALEASYVSLLGFIVMFPNAELGRSSIHHEWRRAEKGCG